MQQIEAARSELFDKCFLCQQRIRIGDDHYPPQIEPELSEYGRTPITHSSCPRNCRGAPTVSLTDHVRLIDHRSWSMPGRTTSAVWDPPAADSPESAPLL